MADNCLSPLAQIMADVLFIIALRQFWSSGLFFWQTRFTKKQGGTGLSNRSDHPT
jgi:hypothetical protein